MFTEMLPLTHESGGGGGNPGIIEFFEMIKYSGNDSYQWRYNSETNYFGFFPLNDSWVGKYISLVKNSNTVTITATEDIEAMVVDGNGNVTTNTYTSGTTIQTYQWNLLSTGAHPSVFVIGFDE